MPARQGHIYRDRPYAWAEQLPTLPDEAFRTEAISAAGGLHVREPARAGMMPFRMSQTGLQRRGADLARLEAVADREWAEREHGWRFTVAPGVEVWAHRLLAKAGALDELADTPLIYETAPRWRDALGLAAVPSLGRIPLGVVLEQVVAAAVRDSVLVSPEPGVVALAFAARDAAEDQTRFGWGFRPAGAQALVVHADRAVALDRLAGGPTATGLVALVYAVEVSARSLMSPRRGPVVGWPRHADGTTVLP